MSRSNAWNLAGAMWSRVRIVATETGHLIVPALLVFIAGFSTLWFGFVYDDEFFVQDAVSKYLTDPIGLVLSIRRPAKVFSFALDEWLFDGASWGYHLTSLLWASLNAALVGLIIRSVSRSSYAALVGGSVFAVHPVHVETVANIANRKDLLAFAFAAVAIASLAPTLLSIRTPRLRHLIVPIPALLLSILSKEIVAAGLLGILATFTMLGITRSRRGNSPTHAQAKQRIGLVVGFIVLAGVLAVHHLPDFSSLYSPSRLQSLSGDSIVEPHDWLIRAFAGVSRSIILLLLPLDLSADHPIPPGGWQGILEGGLGLALLLTTFFVGIRIAHRNILLGMGLSCLAPALLPVANLLPLSHFFVADRYLYLPSLSIALLVGGIVVRPDGSRARQLHRPNILVFVLILLALIGTLYRYPVWRDGLTLWSATVRSNSNSYRAHNNYGRELRQRGEHARAEFHFRRALDLGPTLERPSLHANLGLALASQRRNEEAVAELRTAVGLATRNDRGVFGCMLGTVLLDVGNAAAAAPILSDSSRRLIPTAPTAWCRFRAGEAMLRLGNSTEAVEEMERAAALAPDDRNIRDRLAGYLELLQEPCRAVAQCNGLELRRRLDTGSADLQGYCDAAVHYCTRQRGIEVLIGQSLKRLLSGE